jgi:oxygen-independent coproporphyrinogen-3 oxidase
LPLIDEFLGGVVLKNPIGIYIHIPFCSQKCPYCSFYSVVPTKELVESYTLALISDISSHSGIVADTVYFGGGTPILLGIENLIKVLEAVKKSFVLLNPEITIEVNPNSISLKELEKLFNAGFNRISFGMQTSNEKELALLGRKHNSNDVKKAVENAKKVGFKNISLDVMLGISDQTISSIKTTLDFAFSLDITHISSYMLKFEPNTPFYLEDKNKFPDEDLVSDFYLFAVDYLEKNGFHQYEISNFSKKEFQSKHNNKYWNLVEYLGFGASAHSFYDNKRFFYSSSIDDYISKKESVYLENSTPDLTEYVMLKLRLVEGLDVDILEKLYDIDAKKMLKLASEQKYKDFFKVENNKINLTPKGFLLSNSLILYLLK